MATLRIGVLGAARITPQALVKPAKGLDEVEVAAVAARDRGRAQAFADRHGIARVHDSYEALIADPDLDAIYNPLPNGLHAEWTIAALEAGKHVLCEKPFASNEDEARAVAAVADAHPELVVMEAFHYRYHPFAEQMAEVCRSGELGTIRQIDTWMCVPLPFFKNIRYDFSLAGGATMDVGCYAIHAARLLSGGEPTVTWAKARLKGPDIDRSLEADVSYPGGATGTIRSALWSADLFNIGARVIGSEGTMHVKRFTTPQLAARLKVATRTGRRTIRADRTPTYSYQLRAFAEAVLRGGPVLTPPSDSIATMAVIDAMYDKAGLPRRGT